MAANHLLRGYGLHGTSLGTELVETLDIEVRMLRRHLSVKSVECCVSKFALSLTLNLEKMVV